MRKNYKKLICVSLLCLISYAASANEATIGYVNFKECVEKSKQGQFEKNGFDSFKKQMGETLQKTENELEDLAKKLQDKEYMDGLSPSAEEELKMRFQALSQDFGNFQNQYYQLLNQANLKMLQSLHGAVCSAAELVRDRNHLTFLMNEDSVFASPDNLNFTDEVVQEMDKKFEMAQATANLDVK